MQSYVVSNRRQKAVPPPPVSTPEAILPYYGTGPITTNYTEALIIGLANRGSNPSRFESFTLTSNSSQYLYYAYPVEYGLGTFIDRDNNMEGGWDGALMHLGQTGPAIVNVNISGRGVVQFYLYRTEWTFNATTRWKCQ